MTSTKRVKANRRNARRSTGPRTAAGKQRSRMNALKHGLDAKTIVLSDEDEAAFRSRVDSWRATVCPRNPLEDSLVEEAARLSWQLDRTERLQATRLTERIQAAGDVETIRRQAEAEAEELGSRLVAGVPAPVFRNRRVNQLIGGKRIPMPLPPEDPNHPQRLLERLMSTAIGCDWLLERWTDLRRTLDTDGCWHPADRVCAVRLLGREPADAVDDPMVQSVYLGCFVLGANDAHVFDDQAEEMTRREFYLFLERLEGREARELLPPSREVALEGLRALADGVIIGLQAMSAMHTAHEHDADRAAMAADRLAFDDTPLGERLRRLQCKLRNSILRTIDRLRAARRRPPAAVNAVPTPVPAGPDARSARQNQAETVAATPETTVFSAKRRNEPNAGPPPPDDSPASEPVSTASAGARDGPEPPDEPTSDDLRDDSDCPVRSDAERSYNLDPADASFDRGQHAMPPDPDPSCPSAPTGENPERGSLMESREIVSQFSINRLDGESVPGDLQILLPRRDELAGRSGIHLVLDADWAPWTDTGGLREAVRSDPDRAADLRARAEVCRYCAFIAHDQAGQYLGYWRGPNRRKVAGSPIVVLDGSGQFHLCAAQTFAEAVLERAYGRDPFRDLRDWLQSLGIGVGWENPAQLTFPHEKLPPRELHRQLSEGYRRSLKSQ